MKCEICKKEIEENVMGKIKGAVVKIKVNNRIVHHYICSTCQAAYHNKLNELKEILQKA